MKRVIKQKRRATLQSMRREIECKQLALELKDGLLADMRGRLDGMRATFERIVDIVGPYSYLLPDPSELRLILDANLAKRSGQVRMPAPFKISPLAESAYLDPTSHDFQYFIMEILQVDAIQDHLTCMQHCRVTLSDGTVRYAVAREVLENMPYKVLAKDIGERIARELLDQLRRPAKSANRAQNYIALR